MKIIYDHQIFLTQVYGGISRYFYEIITGLRRRDNESEFKVCAFRSVNYYFRGELSRKKLLKRGNGKLSVIKLLGALMFAALKGKKYDIMHPTYYYAEYYYRLQLGRRIKLVVTVHDMTHEHFIQDDKYTINSKKRLLHSADGIIAVSEYTKRDLLNIYPELKDKPIKVIYHGNSLGDIDNNVHLEIELPSKYILFVGNREGYKNFNELLNSFGVFSTNRETVLVCVGGGNFSEEEKAYIHIDKLDGKVKHLNLGDEELKIAYKNALCLVFPSLYEGFGIPILEAFSKDCPVILKNASCFPEIAKDAALYFDNEDELVYQMERIASNEQLRQQLIRKGRKRLKDFSWEKAVEETYDFYEKICELRN